MKNFPLKKVLFIVCVGVVVLIVVSIIRAIISGEKAVANIVLAPINAFLSLFNGVKNLFTVSDAAPDLGAAASVGAGSVETEGLGLGIAESLL